jgi:hypothetical protein
MMGTTAGGPLHEVKVNPQTQKFIISSKYLITAYKLAFTHSRKARRANMRI